MEHFKYLSFLRSRRSFTLIELLIVIGIIAIISVVVIVVLNPQELIKQARDSTRFSDIAVLERAISIFEVDRSTAFMGTSTVVYVSVPDTSSTCANLGLPSLPSGWTYNCASTSTLQNVDGTGWIPADLTSISTGSPLDRLPIDPTNATSTGLYYTYVAGGSFELQSFLESKKRMSQLWNDEGIIFYATRRATIFSWHLPVKLHGLSLIRGSWLMPPE